MSEFDKQLEKIGNKPGFIAALDQSGGSTPKALSKYGVAESAWKTEQEMFDLVHKMRQRIVTNPSFNGDRILGAILFENTMEDMFDNQPTPDYLWKTKGVVPFLKVDKGLADERNGVQMMKPMPTLDNTLSRAKEKNIFGTKMRSVIKVASKNGIENVVTQQFSLATRIIEAGFVPIVEPEVDINCPDKKNAETLLREVLEKELSKCHPEQKVILKLTLPDEADFFLPLATHDNVLRVVALSGGYSREEANRRLLANKLLVASFSRALTEGLLATQDEDEFTEKLNYSIESIYQSSL